MNDATLQSLLAAVHATPDNATLRLSVAQLLLDGGQPRHALAIAIGDTPELQIIRARALHATGDRAGALSAYEAAVRGNPTLENRDLRAQFAASETVHDGDNVK